MNRLSFISGVSLKSKHINVIALMKRYTNQAEGVDNIAFGGGISDLIVSSFSAQLRTYGTPLVRGVGANYVVTNQGSADAVSSCLDFYLSRDAVIDGGDVYVGRRSTPALAAGNSYGSYAGFTLPSNKWQLASGPGA